MSAWDFTLSDVIRRNARIFGDRLAFLADGQRVTHAEYLARVERLASGLTAAGVTGGDRIGILAQNGLPYVDLYGAAAQLGAIVVPISWRLTAQEIAFVIADTTPRVVIAGTEHQASIAGAHETFPFVEHWYAIGEPARGFAPFSELTTTSPRGRQPGSLHVATPVAADTGFVIIHTAAVGGRPRGAVLSHGGLVAAGAQLLYAWSLGPHDVNLCALPLFHVSGLGLMLATQHAGGASVVMPRFDVPTALESIRDEHVTLLAEFAPMLGMLLDGASDNGRDLETLRIVTGLDSPETIARLEAICPGVRFWAAYGQSELSGLVTLSPSRERPGAAGRPALLSRVAIVDDADHELPTGNTGEIVVRGPAVFKGYWNRDHDNAFTFRNGWHHTGDLGRFDDDGYLWYAGRSPAKELIKTGGENVYPVEVEQAALEHPAIAEIVVLGVRDPQWGEAIKAVCVRRPGHDVDAAALIEFIGARIARFKRPKHVVFVDALPRCANGAVDRAKIKEAHGDVERDLHRRAEG